jgi:predicted transcriptional regulator
MNKIAICLDDEVMARLRAWADESQMKIEELASILVEASLDDHEADGELTPEQCAAIEAGLKAIEAGDVVPHEQVMAELDALFAGRVPPSS